MQKLDEVDRGILSSLQTDVRQTTNTEIADEIGVSPATIGDRIDRMRSAGVIETSYASIDYERAGFPHYLQVTCSVPTTEREELAERTMDYEGIVGVRELLGGERNLQIEIVGPSRDSVSETVRSLESAGVDVQAVDVLEAERHRPFNGLEGFE